MRCVVTHCKGLGEDPPEGLGISGVSLCHAHAEYLLLIRSRLEEEVPKGEAADPSYFDYLMRQALRSLVYPVEGPPRLWVVEGGKDENPQRR